MMRHRVLFVTLLTLGTIGLAAQTIEPTPALTMEQKQQLQLVAKDIEIWQLKAQQAASEYQKARDLLQNLIAQATPAGYQLTDQLELVKVPAATPAVTPPKAADPSGKPDVTVR